MTQPLFLVRGLPGSGKTTFAEVIAKKIPATHVENDQFFIDDHGEFRFDQSRMADAVRHCFTRAEHALRHGDSVVVANVFSKQWHMDDYRKLAVECHVPTVVIHMTGDYGSVHGVPEWRLQQMRDSWEELDEHRYQGETLYQLVVADGQSAVFGSLGDLQDLGQLPQQVNAPDLVAFVHRAIKQKPKQRKYSKHDFIQRKSGR